MAEGDATMPTADQAREPARGVNAVHWAKNGTAPSSTFPSMTSWQGAPAGGLIWACGLNLVVGAIILSVFTQMRSVFSIGISFAIVMAMIVLFFVAFVVKIRRAFRAAAEQMGRDLGESSDPSYRVRCYGSALRIAKVRARFDDGRSSGFDPVVRFARFAMLKFSTVLAILMGAPVLSMIAVLVAISAMKSQASSWLIQLSGWGAALLYAVLVAAVFPAYYRVSPGRLEVLRAGFLGRGLRVTETYDLATLYLTVDVGMRIVYFTRPFHADPGCHQPIGWVSYQAIREPEDFAAVVLQAALCNVAAPPLPTDRLS